MHHMEEKLTTALADVSALSGEASGGIHFSHQHYAAT